MSQTTPDYPYQFQTAIIVPSPTPEAFADNLAAVADHDRHICITKIFQPAALEAEAVDLDSCFISYHEAFPRKQLKKVCPILPIGNPKHLRFICQYILYLGIKQVAVEYSLVHHPQLIEAVSTIQRILHKGNITFICLVEVSSNTQTASETYRGYVDFRRKALRQGSLNCSVCLRIGENLGEAWVKILERWCGQKISFISFEQGCFLMNKKGYPVLGKAHQTYGISCMRKHCNIGLEWGGGQSRLLEPYLKYFEFHLLEKSIGGMSKQEMQAQGQLDFMRDPLQPYIDNLEAQIYDIFEQDTLKYTIYGQALLQAFHSLPADRIITVYYVGCGKGQILKKVMEASKETKKKVKVYCLDKNPYPIQTVKKRVARYKWQKFVEIVLADMRTYNMPEHPDVIVSELLGGFGDNELSPECVRWAEKWATKDTIIIPQKYTSFIRPVSTQTLYSKLAPADRYSYYVVRFGLHHSPFASQSVWSFSHPLNPNDNLERQGSVRWQAPYDVAIQGLQATFDCTLWGKAYFSIVAETHNKNFYSWFPWFVSFEEELVMEKGDMLEVWMKRRVEKACVWYQWRYEMKSQTGEMLITSKWHNQTGKTAVLLEQ